MEQFLLNTYEVNDTNKKYIFGRDTILNDLFSVFEGIEKKYLETIPGQILYVNTSEDNNVICGKNVVMNKAKTHYFSTNIGLVSWNNNQLNVFPYMEIRNDVSNEIGTGNIDYDGSIIVLGAITKDSKVKVTGDVFALKVIDAKIECGGNLIVRDGIIDVQENKINVGGYLKTTYIKNCKNINVAGTVMVEDFIKNSELYSGKSIYLTGPGKKSISCSKLFAREEILAYSVGSQKESIFSIDVGTSEEETNKVMDTIIRKEQLIKERDKIISDKNVLENHPEKAIYKNRIDEYNKTVEEMNQRLTSLEQIINPIFEKMNFEKVREYFKKYEKPSEENIDPAKKNILNLYLDLKKDITEKIESIDNQIFEIENGMLDDKALEKIEGLEENKKDIKKRLFYIKDIINLFYLPSNQTKVVLDYEKCELNVGLFKEEQEKYKKLSEQKQFCLKSLKRIENEKKDEIDDFKAASINKNKQTVEQINETLSKVEEELLPLENILNNKKKCIAGAELEFFPEVVIYLDGQEKIIDKKQGKIFFTLNNNNMVMEGYRAPDLKNVLFEQNILTSKTVKKPFEEYKLRKNLLIEGFDTPGLYNAGLSILNIKQNNSLFIDLERYAFKNRKTLRLNIIQMAKSENKTSLRKKFFKLKKNYPIQVIGSSVKECLTKAAEHFEADIIDLDYEVLQVPTKSLIYIKKQPYILKVFKVGKAKLDVDGFFVLLNSVDGLFLTVFPPKGNGKAATYLDIENQLKEFNYKTELKLDLIKKEIENPTAEEIYVGPRQPEPELDGKYYIKILDDKMKAVLFIIPPEYGGLPVTIDQIKEKIDELKLKNVNYKLIEKSLKKLKRKVELIIAEGIAPTKGTDAKITFPFLSELMEDEDEIEADLNPENLYGKKPLENVDRNEIIAMKEEAKPGVPGKNIFGEEIPAPKGKNFKLRAGKNTYLSDDGLSVYSKLSGMAFIDGYKIYVEDALRIPGNIDNHTGNIDFPGSVIIGGAIKDGFSVNAGGDIYVSNIESAQVSCDGNLYVRRGLAGNYKSKINVKGNLITNFIEQSTIFCGGNVIVTTAIMHSVVNAKKNILVLTRGKGLIVGGIIRAGKSIFAKILGANIATVTTVEAGTDPEIFATIKKLDAMVVKFNNIYKQNRLNIKRLNAQKKLETLDTKKAAMLEELRNKDKENIKRLQKLIENRKKLVQIVEQGRKGKICVKEKCYSGVRLTISTAKIKVTKITDFVTYFYLDQQIRIKPYESPSESLLKELKAENIKLIKA